jgi:hypothetical protein
MTGPRARVELRAWPEGWSSKARIERVSDRLPRTFGGLFATRDEAIKSTLGWALGWLRRMREGEHERTPQA